MGFFKEVFKQAAVNIAANALTGNNRKKAEKPDQKGCTGCLLVIFGFLLLSLLGQNPQVFLTLLFIASLIGILALLVYVIAKLVERFQDYLAERRANFEYAKQMEIRNQEKEAQEQAEHEQFLEYDKWHGIPEIRKAYYALKRILEEKNLIKQLQIADSIVDDLVKAKYIAFDHLDSKTEDQKELEVLKLEITRLGKSNDPEYFLPLKKLEEKIMQHEHIVRNFRQTAEQVNAFLLKLRLQAVAGETIEDNEAIIELKRLSETLEQNIKTFDKV
jgi:uncharacterized protein (UPF0147 family)